jgi:thiamine biosynthesis protein ThiS
MITAKGESMDWHEGLTLKEVLSRLGYGLPIVTVFLDGTAVIRDRWETTLVPDGATVAVYPMMSGG